MNPPILTLTTDFGPEGPYVAAMKGVVLSRAPRTQFVDVSHTITPQNILEGAYVLSDLVETFPSGTVHLAVIDPGVGTERRLIAAAVANQWFVLPDNGLLSGVTRRRVPTGIWELTNPALRRATVSATFHGRDILAPAAAHLLGGGNPDDLGPPRTEFICLKNFQCIANGCGAIGEVLFRDSFGNLISNIPADVASTAPAEAWALEIAGIRVDGLVKTYADRPSGTLVALVGSTGWIEIAVVNGDAARLLSAGPGTTVWLRRKL